MFCIKLIDNGRLEMIGGGNGILDVTVCYYFGVYDYGYKGLSTFVSSHGISRGCESWLKEMRKED
jgi:hypothetical protein